MAFSTRTAYFRNNQARHRSDSGLADRTYLCLESSHRQRQFPQAQAITAMFCTIRAIVRLILRLRLCLPYLDLDHPPKADLTLFNSAVYKPSLETRELWIVAIGIRNAPTSSGIVRNHVLVRFVDSCQYGRTVRNR